MNRRTLVSLFLPTLFCVVAARAAEPELVLKENDVWVMTGDSITAQRLHTNYLEAYYRTRHPQLHLHFRNSGIGGNKTANVLARFDYDVAAWKPTIVSVELGMNDVNAGDDPAAYVLGIRNIVSKIRAAHAQPVLISSSPVNDGSRMNDWKSERCQRLHPYTEALRKLAAELKVVFIDQYHPLVEVWGANRKRGEEAAIKAGTFPPPPAPPAPPVDGKPPKPAAPPIPPMLIPLGGDPVHPGPAGQYHMAAVILAGLKATGEVSSATIGADGKVAEARRCKISNASAPDGKLIFTRLDEAGPWPIHPAAKEALKLMPEMLKLSEYTLRVTALPEGRHRVTINGNTAATLDAKELAAGWNMTTAFDERSSAILALIGNLQSKLNIAWREASKASDGVKLAEAQRAIDESEKEIHKACQPVPLRFEIEKVK